MDDSLELEKAETAALACLKLNNKIYPVFEGHNSIGRDAKATVNIKNLSISKTHAIITILEKKTHYLSDFKSMNGTRLNTKRLAPLKLYQLNNGASIKFGDVFCTYKTLNPGEDVQPSAEESQNYSQSVYRECTQQIQSQTFVDGLNVNEMPTQIFERKEIAFNEMPTQIFEPPANNRDESSNDSIDFMTMQKATESQMVSSDEARIVPVQLNSSKILDSSDGEDEPPASQIQPVKTGKKNVIDSDTDTEEYLQNQIDNKSRYHISDDSETDIEDRDRDLAEAIDESSRTSFSLQIAETENGGLEEQTRCKVVGDDHIYCRGAQASQGTQVFETEKSQNGEEPVPASGNGETLPEADKEENLNSVATGKTEFRENDKEDSTAVETGDKQNEEPLSDKATQQLNFDLVPNKDTSQEEAEPDEDTEDYFQPTQQLQLTQSVPQTKDKPTEEGLEDDEIFMLPTQTLEYLKSSEPLLEVTQDLPEPASVASTSKEQEDRDLLPPPSQAEVASTSKEQEDQDSLPPPQPSVASRSKEPEDQDVLPPTQALEEIHGPEPAAPSKNAESSMVTENDELFHSTQALEDLLEDDGKKEERSIMPPPKFNTPSPIRRKGSSRKKDEDEDLLPPTQALEQLLGEEEVSKSSSMIAEDDDFLPSTQALEDLLQDEGKKSPPPAFKTPSPLRKKGLVQKKAREEDEDDILQPTQALEALHEDASSFSRVQDEMYEIFASQSLLATQQLVDVLDDDIIDDSMTEQSRRSLPSLSFKRSKPISAESVKEILEGDLDGDGKTQDLNVTGKAGGSGNVRTYSRRKDDEEEEKETEAVEGKRRENSEETDGNEESQESAVVEKKRRGSLGKPSQETEKEQVQESDKENKTGSRRVGNRRQEKEVGVKEPIPEKPQTNSQENRRGRSRKEQVKDEEAVEEDKKNSQSKTGRRKEEVPESDKKKGSTEESRKGGRTRGQTKNETKVVAESSIVGKKSEENPGTGRKANKSEDDGAKEKSPHESRRGRSRKDQVNDEEKGDTEPVEEDEKNSQSKTGRRKEEGTEESRKGGRKRGQTKNEKQIVEELPTEDQTGKKGEENPGPRRKLNKGEDDAVKEKSPELDKEKPEANSQERRRGRSRKDQAKDEESVEVSSKEDDEKNSQQRMGRKIKQNDGVKEQVPEPDVNKSSANTEEGTKSGRKRAEQSSTETQTGKANKENTRTGRKLNKHEEVALEESDKTKLQSRGRSKKEEDKEEESSKETKKKAPEASRKSGRRSQNLTSDSDSQDTKDEQSTPKGRRAKEHESSESKKATKRKKDEDEPASTPAKMKKTDSVPRKRTNADSEDEFETKVPKMEPPRSSRRLRTPSRKILENSDPTSSETSDSEESSRRQRRLSANSRRQKREEEMGKTVMETPERNKRQLKPKVVFTMMDNPALESLIRQLGGLVVDSVDASTVLVTENVKRSLKLLCAVAQGKPVCSPQWLQACKKASKFVDPWEYVLVDKEAEKKWGFSLRESLERAAAKKLLEDYTFQLMVNSAADVLKGAIEACGGKCVTRNLAKSEGNLVIVSDEKNKSKYSKIVKQNPEITVVQAEAIFDGTLRQDFQFDKFILL